MAFNEVSCSTKRANTGLKNCTEDFGPIVKAILIPKGASYATKSAAETLANWLTNFNANVSSRWYPLFAAWDIEHEDEETRFEESSLGKREKSREGKRTLRFMRKIAICDHKRLRSFDGGQFDVLLVTENEYVLGTSSDNTKLEGFNADIFVEKQTIATGEASAKSKYTITLNRPQEWDDSGAWVKLSTGNPLDFEGLQDVDITHTGSSTTSALKVTVKRVCDLEFIKGLVVADFKVLSEAGAAQTINTITDNNDGTYVLNFSSPLSAGTYTVSLKDPEDMTTKGYETAASVDITVS